MKRMEFKVLDHQKVLSILPDRDPWAHKGCFGKLLLLCGSRGFTGAAALAARGALRSGAGLVFLGVPESIYAIEAVKLNEPVVFPLPDEDGKLSASAVPEIKNRLPGMDAVLIGPGLGQSSGILSVVRTVLEEFHGPVIVDADGINTLSAHRDLLRGRPYPTIVTPHDVEFTRLGGKLTDDRAESGMKRLLPTGLCAISITRSIPVWRLGAAAMCSPASLSACWARGFRRWRQLLAPRGFMVRLEICARRRWGSTECSPAIW